MKTIEYVIPLGDGARKRHCHESDKGTLADFVVQLEVFAEGPLNGRDLGKKACHIGYRV